MNSLKNISVMDVTLRDGGYLNNWDFNRKTILDIAVGLDKAGVEAVEVGYISDKKDIFLAASCPADLLKLIKEKTSRIKITAMLSLSEKEPAKILESRKDFLDIVRLPSTFDQINDAFNIAIEVRKAGIICSINLLNISVLTLDKIEIAVRKARERKIADIFYLADSRGACSPIETKAMIAVVRKYWDSTVGFHGHDNMGLASANTYSAIEAGADIIDGSIKGLGLGGGNTKLSHAIYMADEENRYKYDILDAVYRSVSMDIPAADGFLYYLMGQKNLAPSWLDPLKEHYGEKLIPFLEKQPKKPYKDIKELL